MKWWHQHLWIVREASALHGSYWQNADDKAFTGWFCSMQKAPQILYVRTTFSSHFRRPKYHVMDHLWLIPSTFHSTQIQQSAGWAGSHRQSDQKGIWRVKKRGGGGERSASVTWVWLSSELWILWQRAVLSPAGTQCSSLLLNWSRQTRLLGFITIGSSDKCAYVWMFSFAVHQCNTSLFNWLPWNKRKMLDSTMAHARN